MLARCCRAELRVFDVGLADDGKGREPRVHRRRKRMEITKSAKAIIAPEVEEDRGTQSLWWMPTVVRA